MATHKASAKAREADKLRKRAKRAKAKLERDLSSGKIKAGSERAKTAQRLIGSLEKTISESYATKGASGKREYTAKAEKALARGSEASQRLKEKASGDLAARRSKLAEIKLNEASRQGGFSTITEAQARLFYRATQEAWEGVPKEERNAAIVRKLGVSDLQEAFEQIMQRQDVQDALKSEGADMEGYTDENRDFYEDEEIEDRRKGSPTFISAFTPIHFG